MPLAARDALAELLLADLAGEHGPRDAVTAALELLQRAAGARVAGQDAHAEACAALAAAGLLERDGGSSGGDGPRSLLRVDPPWASAVKYKLAAYQEVLAGLPRGAALPLRLAQARRLFAHELFFEVHEVLEPAWRSAAGDERETLQGLIQAAVAWHHWQRGNASAASRLADAAGEKLVRAPGAWHGFPAAEVYRCLAGWRSWLRSARGGVPPPLPFADERRPAARR